jgi:hypothetical protein
MLEVYRLLIDEDALENLSGGHGEKVLPLHTAKIWNWQKTPPNPAIGLTDLLTYPIPT